MSEKVPMTIHVGFVGTDGVVIASDTKILSPYGDSFHASKVIFNADHTRLACWAGCELARDLAKRLLRDEHFSHWPTGYLMEQLAEEIFPKERESGLDGEVLFCGVQNLKAIFSISATGNRYTHYQHSDKACIGHTRNPGLFFGERYYRSESINRLIFLASHIVVACTSLNPAGIDGLQVTTITEDKIRQLPEDELLQLLDKCKRLDGQIAKNLFDPSL